MFGPVSGAHFNPVVSFADAALGGLSWRDAAAYLPAQVAGCVTGAVAANLMFAAVRGVHLGQAPGERRARAVGGGRHRRAGPGDLRAGPAAARLGSAPAAVGAYIGAAYWFTTSTSFANPAITIGRMFSNTFAGHRPVLGPGVHRRPGRRRHRRGAHHQVPVSRAHPRPAAGVVVPHESADSRAAPDGDDVASAARAGRDRQVTSNGREMVMHMVAVGGSDAGISAALRAREVDPGAEVTVVVADAYPNFSICGIPYYVSGEVTHWRNLAHRTLADLEAAGMRLRLDTTARGSTCPDASCWSPARTGPRTLIAYDELVIGTGAVPVRPPIAGLDTLGPGDGVHLLHSMGDTFALMRTLDETSPASAVIVGAGYIGLEMAEALTARGLAVTQIEQLPEVLPTVDPELGALVHAELAGHGVEVLHRHRRPGRQHAAPGAPGRLQVERSPRDGEPVTRHADLVLVVVGVRPDTELPVSAGAALGAARRDRRRRDDAHRPAARLRGRGLRRHPPPAARRDLPAARHHRPQAGPGRRGERRSAGTASSPAASAPRSSRSSTRPPPAPACATTKPPRPDTTRSPSPPKPTTTRPTTPAATASPSASPATGPPADCSAPSCSAAGTPRSPSASTSTPPPSSTA